MAGYRTTRLADDDIIDIYVTGVVNFGAAKADRYHAGLLDAFDMIARYPHLAPERSEFIPPVRLHRHEAHHLVYVLGEQGILIVRVLPRRQAWEHLIGAD